ncbi:MAG: ATP-dependent helicase [Geminicoccaceae bacterium]
MVAERYQKPMPQASHLDELNPEQRAAVLYGLGDRPEPGQPLLVIAGAGTGKTKTLAHRVAEMVLRGAHPHRILLLTFSRRAAEEMLRRVDRICAAALKRDPQLAATFPWSGTFHAVGSQILRRLAPSIGLDAAFTILDRGDAADLLDLVREEQGLARTDRRFPRKATCLQIYSLAVNRTRPLGDVLRATYPWCLEWETELKRLFATYVEVKQRENVLDYDDLLLWWERAMRVPVLATEVGGLFDYVLVDEYQDTNPLQDAILRAIRPDGRGVTVVGDDAQAIYAFRGATVRNILDFPKRFEPGAEIVTLDRNYRSTTPILEAANAVIGLAREGFRKRLHSERWSQERPRLAMVQDENAQVDYVVRQVLWAREAGVALKDQAVLFRSAHHSAALELELTRRNIPFVKFGGLKFLEAAHVKDVLAFLRWAENPTDRIAAFRVLQLLPGIGPGTARKALARMPGGRFDALAAFLPPAAAAQRWPALVELMKDLTAGVPWPAQMSRLRLLYEPILLETYDHVRPRLADLEQLERLAGMRPTRQRFLTDLALDPPEAVGDEAGVPTLDEDYLCLSTIHSAKGQEWREVHVLNLVDGCIPSDLATGTVEEIEEERRLLYVAMTRARDALHLIQPLRFYSSGQSRTGDRYVAATRSRFLPAALLHLFDLGGAGLADQAGDFGAQRRPQAPVVDLAADVRSLWK